DVEVTEATDLSGNVCFGRLLFKATDQEHLPVHFDELIARKSAEAVLLADFCLVSFLFELFRIGIRRCVDCLFAHESTDYKRSHKKAQKEQNSFLCFLWLRLSHHVD